MEVAAPMPIAMVVMAIAASVGLRRQARIAMYASRTDRSSPVKAGD
jgi:hypothetical protein